MGGGLATSIASARKRTIKGKRVIDYDLVMLTLPMLVSGTIFGVNFPNKDTTESLPIRSHSHNNFHLTYILHPKDYLQINPVIKGAI